MSATLTHWTKRVIEIKSQELDVVQYYSLSVQRWDFSRLSMKGYQSTPISRTAFQKWKACRRRHVEQTSLLENHLLLKREGWKFSGVCKNNHWPFFSREDILRRAFHRWLAAKRAREHRRETYQRKEALLRRTIIITAWERWRERFMEEKLQPLVRDILEWLISGHQSLL